MNTPPIRIAPSLLACDFTRLAEDLADVEAGGADWHHVDVMDGHFVPNISIGPPVVASIAKVARVPLDVHLMISEPARYAGAFAKAGAHVLTFHIEVARDIEQAREIIVAFRDAGIAQVGVALNPATAIETVADLLDEVDLVLVMSVVPGFGGQAFMPEVLDKVRWLRAGGFQGEVEMDGGLDLETVPLCVEAGANALVAGSAIYGSSDRGERMALLRAGAGAAAH
ncbi:MAG: ribulose-phosphate 3-epimerase [bacterium]|nr:ribulose-phosphate 3-epimerase [Planctomycetota bacterium]HIL51655.1 ribulose-phosphate 3-epimerase [Planctomycetota bacterium]